MTDPFEHLLRSTLTEMAEEAPTVQDALNKAEGRVRSRQRNAVVAGAAGVLAALVIAAPMAFADGKNDGRPTQPANTVPFPSPSDPGDPVPSPSGPGDPISSPGGPGVPVPSPSEPGELVPSPSGPGDPIPSPSKSG